MKIVTTFHASSSVFKSIKCQLSSREAEHLVVAKTSRLEVYSIQPQGLHLDCTTEIWGLVISIQALPIKGSTRSNIVVMTGHPEPELLFFTFIEPETGDPQLISKHKLSMFERSPRMAEFYNNILVHPSGDIAVAHYYTGKLKVIVLKAGNYLKDFDVSLHELNILSLAFLYTPDEELVLAILYNDASGHLQLTSRDIHLHESDLSHAPSLFLPPSIISSKTIPYPTEQIPFLIPVPSVKFDAADSYELFEEPFQGGVLIAGGVKIVLYEQSSKQGREKLRGKRKRLDTLLASSDSQDVMKATEKERERGKRERKIKASVVWPWSEVTAWCAVDKCPTRFLLGDSYGRLCMLTIDVLKDRGLVIIPLGQSSSPTTLTYLSSQFFYLGSHFGDSKLLQIHPSPISNIELPTLQIPAGIPILSEKTFASSDMLKGGEESFDEDVDMDMTPNKGCVIEMKGTYITVMDTYKNIAPIRDAILVDTDGSGQRQVVTCSGGQNTGSINIVRTGADFQELAYIPGITDVTKLWSVRDMMDDHLDSHVLASTIRRTFLFRINDNGRKTSLSNVEESPTFQGLVTTQRTLAFSNVAQRVLDVNGRSNYMNSSLVVQVVPSGAYLLEFDQSLGDYVQKACWVVQSSVPAGTRPLEIVAASINASQIALALSGGKMVVLNVTDKTELRISVDRQSHSNNLPEISAISCSPLNPIKSYTQLITVAYWASNIVEIFAITPQGFTSVCKSEPLPSLVRSLLFFDFGSNSSPKSEDHHPYLLAGLSDGSVVYYTWRNKQLKDKSVVSLGNSPVELTVTEVGNTKAVLAAGNRAIILSWQKKWLNRSPIMVKEIRCAASLNTLYFKSSVILATPTGLFIGRIHELDKMHISTVALGLDNPVRIAHHPTLKVFGVACKRTEPSRIASEEPSTSSFSLFDDTTLRLLSKLNCELDEEITAVASLVWETEEHSKPLFCLGTFIFHGEEKEPVSGKLRVCTADGSEALGLELAQIASVDVKGCVYALTIVNNNIVAAVNSSVMLFKLDGSDEISAPSMKLSLLSEWNHNYIVSSLASNGDYIVAGDQISSVSLIKVSDSKITSIARDYGPLWPIAVEAFDENHIIGANDAFNLFSFSLVHHAQRSVLERDGSYYVADTVTKFIRGAVSPVDTKVRSTFVPEQVFVATSGCIGVIIDVKDSETALTLTKLQQNLATIVKGVGGTIHTRYRSPKNTRGQSDADSTAFGFLDGDFLERFLGMVGSSELQKVMNGSSKPERIPVEAEDIQKTLEDLQRLH